MGEKRCKVLVVDDDKDVRTFLNRILTCNGFIVEEAEDGQEGMEKVLENKPDIILLDGKMPRLDGIQMFRLLRANPETKNIPVILCTSSYGADHINDIRAHNGDYLKKPFNCVDLYDKINKALGTSIPEGNEAASSSA